VRPLADDHACALTLHDRCGSVILETDPRRVRQILLNLLSNAIKFGHGRPIDVVCDRRDGWLEITVTDRGPGIARADLPRIFDEFVQLEHAARASGPSQPTGTGLGLPISKRLAELLGGTLEAESELGVGSTFRLRLPIAPAGRDGAGRDGAGRDGATAADAPAAAAPESGARAAGGSDGQDGTTPARVEASL
jgi:signal transduction histidine kinase